MRFICPRCQRTKIANPNTEDFICECNSLNPVLDNEDIKIVGEWEDYTGDGTELNTNLRGAENKLFGTRAQVLGEDVEEINVRGNRETTHRTRQHLEFIKVK